MRTQFLTRRKLLGGVGASLALPRAARATVGKGQRAAVVTSVAQPVIHLIAGQSNMFYGVAFNAAVDLGSTEFFQMYSGHEGTANTISTGGADDPLDNVDPSGISTPAIGPHVHFYRDYYCPAYHPAKVLFLPSAYGGTQLLSTSSNEWGVTTATGGATIGSLTTNAIGRVRLAKQLWPTAKLHVVYELIEGDFDGYGAAFQPFVLNHWRAAMHCWLLYMRAQMAAIGFSNMPIVIGRPDAWALSTGGSIGSDNWYAPNMVAADIILRAVAARFPYVGIADSMNPTQASYQAASQIHFDEAGQRTMAGRYWNGFLQAISNENFTTAPVWDSLDYLQTALGYSGYNFVVGSGGSSLSGDSTSSWKSALATCPSLPSTSAMLYAEVEATAVATSGSMMIGLANHSTDLQYYLGGSTPNAHMVDYSSAAYWGGQTSLLANGSSGAWSQSAISCPNFVAGDVIQLALNRASGQAWVGRNGAWLASGNPSAGTNPWITGIPQTDMVFIAASIYSGAGNALAISGKASQFAIAPPTGFSAWGV